MKNFVVKAIAVIIGAMLLFTGCVQDSQNDKLNHKDPVSVEIWHYYNGRQKLVFDSLVTSFNETVGQEKGIIVEAFGQGNVNELSQKVQDAVDEKVGAGEVPTAFSAYVDTIYDLNQRNMAVDFDSYFTKEELDEYVDAYIEEGRFDEEKSLKIIPTAKSTEVMMINKTDWDQFATDTGISLTALDTIEGLVEVSADYYRWTDAKTPDVPDDGKPMFGRDAMANYIILGHYQLTEKPLFSHQDGRIIFEPDESAFRKLWDNYYIPYINGWFGAFGRFRSDDAKTGDLIALVGSTSGAYYFPDQVTRADDTSYPIEAAVFPAPCFSGTKPSAIQQGAGMSIITSDPKTELAAITFLKWFADVDRNIEFTVSSSYLPVKKEANDIERIGASEGFKTLPPAVQEAISVSVNVVNEYELYFEQAFSGSSKIREIMEHSLSDRAKANRTEILDLVEDGISLEEAVVQYATDQNFKNWYQDFVDKVRAEIREN